MKETVIAQDEAGCWLQFSNPVRVLSASDVSDVAPVLQEAQSALSDGLSVAGFISYEAASGLDPVFCTIPHGADKPPLIWFGLYRQVDVLPALPPVAGRKFEISPWSCDTDERSYADAIRRIKDYIYAGDTYQVNYTVRLSSRFSGDPYALFVQLVDAQNPRCAVFVDTGRFAVCSASPELFFEREGIRIRARPMKGTAARGLTFEADRQAAQALAVCPKNRAENVMIVDMVRNDLGRIAEPGSVHPVDLFDVETYPTVHQMVSTVEAESRAGLMETVRALFPCASITGAPKVRTMQIVRELESSPRGIYTGMCGYWLPEGRAKFNVAIRTVVIDRETGVAEYGVGGGVVWDSTSEGEYRECFTKAAVLTRPPSADFQILESLRYDALEGWFLLDEHIRRAECSAAYFGFQFDAMAMLTALKDASLKIGAVSRISVDSDLKRDGTPERKCYKVRWQLFANGRMAVDIEQISDENGVWEVGLALDACRRDDVFLYHKTTCRKGYEEALSRFPGCRDVILVNELGEVTESCFGNVVLEIEGRKVTPPVSSGLLAGVFRGALLQKGELIEERVMPAMLQDASRVWLINSVRQWIPVKLNWGAFGFHEDFCDGRD